MELSAPYSLSRRVPSATRPPLPAPGQCKASIRRASLLLARAAAVARPAGTPAPSARTLGRRGGVHFEALIFRFPGDQPISSPRGADYLAPFVHQARWPRAFCSWEKSLEKARRRRARGGITGSRRPVGCARATAERDHREVLLQRLEACRHRRQAEVPATRSVLRAPLRPAVPPLRLPLPQAGRSRQLPPELSAAKKTPTARCRVRHRPGTYPLSAPEGWQSGRMHRS